jgi:hypothetical protein
MEVCDYRPAYDKDALAIEQERQKQTEELTKQAEEVCQTRGAKSVQSGGTNETTDYTTSRISKVEGYQLYKIRPLQ